MRGPEATLLTSLDKWAKLKCYGVLLDLIQTRLDSEFRSLSSSDDEDALTEKQRERWTNLKEVCARDVDRFIEKIATSGAAVSKGNLLSSSSFNITR